MVRKDDIDQAHLLDDAPCLYDRISICPGSGFPTGSYFWCVVSFAAVMSPRGRTSVARSAIRRVTTGLRCRRIRHQHQRRPRRRKKINASQVVNYRGETEKDLQICESSSMRFRILAQSKICQFANFWFRARDSIGRWVGPALRFLQILKQIE